MSDRVRYTQRQIDLAAGSMAVATRRLGLRERLIQQPFHRFDRRFLFADHATLIQIRRQFVVLFHSLCQLCSRGFDLFFQLRLGFFQLSEAGIRFRQSVNNRRR